MLEKRSEVGLSSAFLALVGCGPEPEPTLVLAGPSEVRAAALGVLPGPSVLLDDGTEPDGVIWTVSHPEVVDVRGNRLVVTGPGEAAVTAEWEGDRVGFRVIVALDMRLGFVDPPETLRVGEQRPLRLLARLGEGEVDPGPLSWESSDPDVVRVEDGTATASMPGTAWVTARARGASAMAELEVVP